MCNQKEKAYIHNLNRSVIAAGSAIAMLIDGVSTANILYLGSAFVWLFLPECDSVEEHLFDGCRRWLRRVMKLNGVSERFIGFPGRATESVQDRVKGR